MLLLGPSGAGKSTLLLTLAGLMPRVVHAHRDGNVRARGAPGIVFQDADAQICMPTVEEDVAFGLENDGVPSAAMPERVDAALRAVGLAERRATRADRLSGGQRQRLALAG
ncbi:MAG: ATP-binding cassette domain-containing protein, partial [Armatimonadetes bacterium]|nr:ATP-binding cassette domain-containing protein [Armatimonadota bacterium]